MPSAGIPWCQRVWQSDFALDQHHVAGLSRLCKPVKPVEAWLGARFPAEAVAIERDPEPDRQFLAAGPK